MSNINCTYAFRDGCHICCAHPDKKRLLKVFRPFCVEPEHDCTLKVAPKKPVTTRLREIRK